MGVYLLLWGGIITACLTLSQKDRHVNYIFLKLVFVLLVVLIGFRHQVGGDWVNYQAIFDNMQGANLLQAMVTTEPAYGFMNWLANQFNLTVHFVNLGCALLFVWGLARLCMKQPQPWFGLLISIPYLVSVVAMGYTRQSAAIGLAMVALVMLIEHRPWHFVALIVAAAFFHKSVVILFGLLPLALPNIKIGKLFFVLLAVASAGLLLVIDRLGGLWNLYVTQGMESDGGLVRVLLNAVPAVCFLLARHKWQKRWPFSYSLLLWLSIAALVLLPLQFLASTAVDRISLYLIPLQIMVFSSLPLLFNGVSKFICIFAIIIVYSSVYLVWLNFSYWAQCCWIPYDNFLVSP